ncbi:MAG: sulfotransferase domain-containing protein [Alphaproteobacteria bacterium]
MSQKNNSQRDKNLNARKQKANNAARGVLIWGCNPFGALIHRWCVEDGIEVFAFIDDNAARLFRGLPIITPEALVGSRTLYGPIVLAPNRPVNPLPISLDIFGLNRLRAMVVRAVQIGISNPLIHPAALATLFRADLSGHISVIGIQGSGNTLLSRIIIALLRLRPVTEANLNASLIGRALAFANLAYEFQQLAFGVISESIGDGVPSYVNPAPWLQGRSIYECRTSKGRSIQIAGIPSLEFLFQPALIEHIVPSQRHIQKLADKKYKFVGCLRNPLDALVSFANKHDTIESTGGQSGLDHDTWFSDAVATFIDWFKAFGQIRDFIAVVNFETLIGSPTESIISLAHAIGVDASNAEASAIWERLSYRQIEDAELGHFREGRVGAWSDALSNKRKSELLAIGFPDLMRSIGYDKDADRLERSAAQPRNLKPSRNIATLPSFKQIDAATLKEMEAVGLLRSPLFSERFRLASGKDKRLIFRRVRSIGITAEDPADLESTSLSLSHPVRQKLLDLGLTPSTIELNPHRYKPLSKMIEDQAANHAEKPPPSQREVLNQALKHMESTLMEGSEILTDVELREIEDRLLHIQHLVVQPNKTSSAMLADYRTLRSFVADPLKFPHIDIARTSFANLFHRVEQANAPSDEFPTSWANDRIALVSIFPGCSSALIRSTLTVYDALLQGKKHIMAPIPRCLNLPELGWNLVFSTATFVGNTQMPAPDSLSEQIVHDLELFASNAELFDPGINKNAKLVLICGTTTQITTVIRSHFPRADPNKLQSIFEAVATSYKNLADKFPEQVTILSWKNSDSQLMKISNSLLRLLNHAPQESILAKAVETSLSWDSKLLMTVEDSALEA